MAQEQEVSLTHLIIHCYNVIVRTDNYNIIVFLAEALPFMFPTTCYPYLGIILWTTCGNIQSNVILLHDIVPLLNPLNLFYLNTVKPGGTAASQCFLVTFPWDAMLQPYYRYYYYHTTIFIMHNTTYTTTIF